MKERYFTRGCVAFDIYEIISKRLYLPGSSEEFPKLESVKVPPGLFFSQSDRLDNIIGTSEQYAVNEASKISKAPFVIIMRINKDSFSCIANRIWFPRVTKGSQSLTSFEYDPIGDFSKLRGRVAVIALDKMTDDDFKKVDAQVGLFLPEEGRFQYKLYEEYLKDAQFKNPDSMDEFNEWLKGFK